MGMIPSLARKVNMKLRAAAALHHGLDSNEYSTFHY
jgi:hypothetical protein